MPLTPETEAIGKEMLRLRIKAHQEQGEVSYEESRRKAQAAIKNRDKAVPSQPEMTVEEFLKELRNSGKKTKPSSSSE